MSGTTSTWTGGNGDFGTAADWSNGVPTANDQGIVVGSFDLPVTVTVGAADTIALFSALSLFDATLAVTAGTLAVGAITTADDTLSAPLSELVVGDTLGHAALLTVVNSSTIGSFTNSQLIGLTQDSGRVVFQNGSSAVGVSVLAGGQGGVTQTGGAIEVDDGTLEIEGNSTFAGTLAAAAATGAGSTGTVDLAGGSTFNFNAGVALDVNEVELTGAGSVLQINANLSDSYLFDQGSGTMVQLSGNTLTLQLAATLQAGSVDFLGGTIGSSGTVVNLGTIDDSGLTLQNAVLLKNEHTIDQNAGIVIGSDVNSATTLENVAGASYTLNTSGLSAVAGNGLFANYGLFATSTRTPAGAIAGITAQFVNEATGSILVTAGTLDFANNDSFAGTIGGGGMFELSGSGVNTLAAGVALKVSSFYVSAANGNGQLQLAILGNLTYAGLFSQDAGTTIQLAPGTVGTKAEAPIVTLTNTGDVSGTIGGTIIGGTTARLILAATAGAPLSDNGMVIRGQMTVEDTGTVSQEGTVTIGLLSGDFETGLVIGQGAKGAVYEFVAPSVLTGDGTITNEATFEQGPQITGTSIVSAYFTSSATVICKSGTLEFTGADTFGGTISGNGLVELSGAVFTLNSGLLITASTLEVSSAAGSAQVNLLGSLTYNQTFVQTGSTTLDLVSGSLSSEPTLTLNGSSELDGTINGLAPTGLRPSEVLVSATGSASDGGMVLTGSVTLLDLGQVSQQSLVTVGQVAGDFHSAVQIGSAASYNITIVSNLVGDGSITNYGTFEQSAAVTGVSVVGADLVSADTVTTKGTTTINNVPTIACNGGVLEFTGADSFSGVITGQGTVALSAAVFNLAANLTTLNVAALEILGNSGAALVEVRGTLLDYGGVLTQSGGTTIALGNTLTASTTLELMGSGDQIDGTIDGLGGATSELVLWTGADETDTGMTLTGNVTLIDEGKIGEAAQVTIGANAGDFSDLLQIDAGKLYNLSEQSTITGAGSILNLGTFEQGVSVTGTSVVAVDFDSNATSSTVLGTTGTLLFSGADAFGGTITGAGAVELANADYTFDAGIVLTVATLEIVDATVRVLGNLTYDGTLGLNGGEFSEASGVSVTVDGTLVGSGTVNGSGLLYQSTGSESGLTLSGSETLFDTGFVGQTGDVTIGVNPQDHAELNIEKAATYAFRAASVLTGGGIVVNNGQFGQGSGASISNLVNVASFDSTGIVFCDGGTIEFSGTDTFGGTSTTAGSIEGGGLIEFSGGTFTFAGVAAKAKGGLAVTVGTLDLATNIGAAQLNVSGIVVDSGSFLEAAGNTVSLEAGATLSLTGGSDTLNGAFGGAAGSELLFGSGVSVTDDGMTVTGALWLLDTGSVSQGAAVNLGVSAGDSKVTLQITPTGSYTLDNNAAIAGFGSIVNNGVLTKAGTVLGGGTSTIAPMVVNGGQVTADAGMLVFNATMQNSGTVNAISGATVEFGGAVTVAATHTGTIEVGSTGVLMFGNGVVAAETVLFNDAAGFVDIANVAAFDATIKGFQAIVENGTVVQSDSIDLTELSRTGLTVTYTQTGSAANPGGVLTLSETVNGKVASYALNFAGTYTAASFALSADASGQGTIITDPPSPTPTPISTANTSTTSMAFTNLGSATETAALVPAGNGAEQVFGFRLKGLDVLDLGRVLADAAGHPTLADIGGYITASFAGGDTTLAYDPTGHGHGTAFAVLEGVHTTVAGLLAHHALSLG